MPPFTISKLLQLCALLIFVLAAVSFSIAGLNMVALGLAFYAASLLVP